MELRWRKRALNQWKYSINTVLLTVMDTSHGFSKLGELKQQELNFKHKLYALGIIIHQSRFLCYGKRTTVVAETDKEGSSVCLGNL